MQLGASETTPGGPADDSIGTFIDDALEIVQGTYINAMTRLYCHDDNCCHNTHADIDPSEVDGDDPARTVELREVARRLYGVLDALSPEMRIAYALHVVDGRPLREVAKLTDATLVATKTRVWRARRAVEARAARDPVLAEWVG